MTSFDYEVFQSGDPQQAKEETDRRVAADIYERRLSRVYEPIDAMLKQSIGTTVQRYSASVETLARRCFGAVISESGAKPVGPMLRAMRADVTPVGMYRNVQTMVTLATQSKTKGKESTDAAAAPPGSAQPIIPIRSDSSYNVALKLIPGWKMAAAVEVALSIMQERSKFQLRLPIIMEVLVGKQDALFPKPVQFPPLLAFCTPINFALYFPLLLQIDRAKTPLVNLTEFFDANDHRPVGLFANEFCDTVCAAFGAGYSLEEVIAHYMSFLRALGKREIAYLDANLRIEQVLDPFVRGINAPSESAIKDVIVDSRAVVESSPQKIIGNTDIHTNTLVHPRRPRVKMVCPFPFLAWNTMSTSGGPRIELAYVTQNMRTILAEQKLLDARGAPTETGVPTLGALFPKGVDWMVSLKWESRIQTWATQIHHLFVQRVKDVVGQTPDLSPEREIGERSIPSPVQNTVAHVVSDTQVLTDKTGRIVLASDVAPRVNSYAILVNGSTRIWRWAYPRSITPSAGEQVSIPAALTGTSQQAFTSDIWNNMVSLEAPLIVFDETVVGSTYTIPSLLPPTFDDIALWFSFDANISLLLGDDALIHYIDLARYFVQVDSNETLHGVMLRTVDFMGIPPDKNVRPEIRKAADNVGVEFGRLVSAIYQNDRAEASTRLSLDSVRLNTSNVREYRRRLYGLRFLEDRSTGIRYLSLPDDGPPQWLPGTSFTGEGGPWVAARQTHRSHTYFF